MGKWLNTLALSSALASAEIVHAEKPRSDTVEGHILQTGEDKKLDEILQHTPINLVVVGDASGSYSMNSREANLAKFKFLMGQLRPGVDYLQAYMLGMKPFDTKKNLKKIGGTGEEQDLVVTAGKRSFSQDTVREVEQKLERALGQEGRVNGPHSDSLFVLKHIGQTIDKAAERQIPVLAFFWDGEPNSADDIDWKRHPELEKQYPNMQDRIAGYHEMLKQELIHLRTQKGMLVYVFTPPQAKLPQYAAEVSDKVITPDKGDIEDVLSHLRRMNWKLDLGEGLKKLLKSGDGVPAVHRVAEFPEVKVILEELGKNPGAVTEKIKRKVDDVTGEKTEGKNKKNQDDASSENLPKRDGYLLALGAALTALLIRRFRRSKKQSAPGTTPMPTQRTAADEIKVDAKTADQGAGEPIAEDVIEPVVAKNVAEVEPVATVVASEPIPEVPAEPVEARKVIDDLNQAVADLQAGKEMDNFPNVKEAAAGIDIQDREDIQRLYGSLAALMEGIHNTYRRLDQAEQKAVSPFFYWHTDEDYQEFLTLMGKADASGQFVYPIYQNWQSPEERRDPNHYLDHIYYGPRYATHALWENILNRFVPGEKRRYAENFFQPYRGSWFFTHQCAYLAGHGNKEALANPSGDQLAVSPTVFREFGLLDDSKEQKTMINLKWEFADGVTLKDFIGNPMKVVDGKIDDNRALGRIEIVYGVPVLDRRYGNHRDYQAVTREVCNRYVPDLEHTNFNLPHNRHELRGFDAHEYPVIEPGDPPPADGQYRVIFDPNNPAHDFKYLCAMMDGIVETVRHHANIPTYRNWKTRALFRRIDGKQEPID